MFLDESAFDEFGDKNSNIPSKYRLESGYLLMLSP
jgi:hypothetical protein